MFPFQFPKDEPVHRFLLNVFNQTQRRRDYYQDPQSQIGLARESPSWLIPLDAIEVDWGPRNRLGAGGYGAVYRGKFHGSPVAIKLLNGKVEGAVLEAFQNEVDLMIRLRHPNVIQVPKGRGCRALTLTFDF